MKTLVVGASINPARVSHSAIHRLVENDHDVLAYGLREGTVSGIPIITDRDQITDTDIHTVTLYVGPARQPDLIDWVTSLKPSRVIFNPGTENPAFEAQLLGEGIDSVRACTLVMLSIGMY